MTNDTFESMMKGAQEALEIAQGTRKPARVHRVVVPEKIDVKEVRKRVKMTQKLFSDTFGFPLANIASWESGRRSPDKAARILLKMIAKNPRAVIEAAS